jgi:predicted trehalose synthase
MGPRQEDLFALATSYLERQAWFRNLPGGRPEDGFSLVTFERIRDEAPGLARLLIARGERNFQLLVGWRPSIGFPDFTHGEESALFGALDEGDERLIVYDALADEELCRSVLELATGGREHAARVRTVASLASHASLVFDERLFMKCYRVLETTTRPEVEVMFGLDDVGFNAMLAPVARWRDHDLDLGLVREFLPSALEGRLLALTSLRDLLGHAAGENAAFHAEGTTVDLDRMAAMAGGDLAGEAGRLGQTTALLHIALGHAFGTRPLTVHDFASATANPSVATVLERPGPAGLGLAIRIHGDYHLRRVMRSESGWLVAGFGDDPLYSVDHANPSLPAREGTPLEDVADMSFALGRVVADALAQRPDEDHGRAAQLAAAWRRRNRGSFLRGYFRTPGIEELLPPETEVRDLLLEGLEEIRERRYEAKSAAG